MWSLACNSLVEASVWHLRTETELSHLHVHPGFNHERVEHAAAVWVYTLADLEPVHPQNRVLRAEPPCILRVECIHGVCDSRPKLGHALRDATEVGRARGFEC